MAYYHSKYGVQRKKKKRFSRIIFWIVLVIFIVAAGLGYMFYQAVYKANVWTPEGKDVSIYIPSNSDYEDVRKLLYENGLIIHRKNFEWWAKKKNYPDLIKPGRYIVLDSMNNYELVNLLRSGNQKPVKVIFNNIRELSQLAEKVSKQIEADSTSLMRTMTDPSVLSDMNLTPETATLIYIPDTYEFYWNTSAEGFVKRMYEEYNRFWNPERIKKAEEIGMTIPEVVTLASIVEKETNKNDEKPLIAGVYINRIEKGWRLQADPTLIYAMGDFEIKRVLNVHKDFESPYNTYKYGGLPPGPICIPSISSIDAVLNYQNEGYLYFCAKDDLSGYHVFAKTNRQHNRNAKKYQKALDNLNIYR